MAKTDLSILSLESTSLIFAEKGSFFSIYDTVIYETLRDEYTVFLSIVNQKETMRDKWIPSFSKRKSHRSDSAPYQNP